MVIFHLISSIDKGGAETHLYSLINKQVQEKKKIYLIYLKGDDYWKKYYNRIGVKVFKINFENNFNILKFLFVLVKIKKIIKKFKPDIVHAHLLTMELIAAIIKFNFKDKFKFIITKHLDSFFLEASFGHKKIFKGLIIDRFIINQSNRVICISKQVKNYFNKEIPHKKKYKVIYYGFSVHNFKSSPNVKKVINKIRKKNKINKNDIVFCNVARHVKQKSIDTILKAFAIYLKHKKNSKLILVGKGPETNNLRVLCNELEISRNVIWINNYENIKDIYILSNVFVLSSKYEGLGLVLLEALSSKIPIIATNTSAIPEIIKNNYNGLLFNPGDFKSLSIKLKKIQQHKLRKKILKNGYNFIKKNFDINKMNYLTNKIYKS